MAVLTITTDAGQDTRFAAAVQRAQGLASPATPVQSKAFVISLLRQFVQQQEYIGAQNQIVSTPFDPT